MPEVNSIEYVAIASVAIPFVVQALKMVCKHFKWKVRSQVLVAIVCAVSGLMYALATTFFSIDVLETFAAVGGVTFVTSQALYKMYEEKK